MLIKRKSRRLGCIRPTASPPRKEPEPLPKAIAKTGKDPRSAWGRGAGGPPHLGAAHLGHECAAANPQAAPSERAGLLNVYCCSLSLKNHRLPF